MQIYAVIGDTLQTYLLWTRLIERCLPSFKWKGGDPDYLIRIATADLATYQILRDEKLAALPGVQRLSSTIVMKRVVDDRPFLVSVASEGTHYRR